MLQGMLYTVASTYERTSTTHFCYAVHVSLRLVLCSLSFIFTAGRGIQKKEINNLLYAKRSGFGIRSISLHFARSERGALSCTSFDHPTSQLLVHSEGYRYLAPLKGFESTGELRRHRKRQTIVPESTSDYRNGR